MQYKKTISLIIISFFIFHSSNDLNAKENIYFVDLNYIVNKSDAGISISSQLKKVNDKNLSFFNKQESNLKKKELKILAKKNVLDKKDFDEKISILSSEINDYNKEKNNRITLMNQMNIKAKNNLIIKLNAIIVEYAEKNSISMVIQKKNILLGKSDLDITAPVFKIFNNTVKTIQIK